MSKVIVVGGGAAGMMAAYAAGRNGHRVTLLEKNEKLGKKIYITGKGRCNVTNASDMDVLFENVVSNRKFLYSAFYTFDNNALVSFMEEHGCKCKVERGERVFPVSDHASDVIAACKRALEEVGVTVRLHSEVKNLEINENGECTGVALADGEKITSQVVIVCTGGLSYPTTGSTGDGMNWAREAGLDVKDCVPALVPFETKETWVKDLQGLALKNVTCTLIQKKKEVYSGFGEMLFTHFGISGPLILSASSFYKKDLDAEVRIDLKPALTEEQLDRRILREFEDKRNRQFKNAVSDLFPQRLIPVMIEQSGIDPEKKVHEITRQERMEFVKIIKNLPLQIRGTRDFNEAIITRGGIAGKEINPSTMESKKIKGLYFAGETLDLDALTGGYNLQIAWSTGFLAGMSVE